MGDAGARARAARKLGVSEDRWGELALAIARDCVCGDVGEAHAEVARLVEGEEMVGLVGPDPVSNSESVVGLPSLDALLTVGNGTQMKLPQSPLSRACDQRWYATAITDNEFDGRMRAARRSASGQGAGAWLDVIPSSVSRRIGNRRYQMAVHLRGGCVQPDAPEGLEPSGADTWGAGGVFHSTHEIVLDAIFRVLAWAGLTGHLVQREPVAQNAGGQALRYDIRVKMTGVAADTVLDLTVVFAPGGSILRLSSVISGAALDAANRRKCRKYVAAATAERKRFVPLAMEVHGRLGWPFLGFLREVGIYAQAAGKCHTRGQFMRHALGEISIALQKGVTGAMLAHWRRCTAGRADLVGAAAEQAFEDMMRESSEANACVASGGAARGGM